MMIGIDFLSCRLVLDRVNNIEFLLPTISRVDLFWFMYSTPNVEIRAFELCCIGHSAFMS